MKNADKAKLERYKLTQKNTKKAIYNARANLYIKKSIRKAVQYRGWKKIYTNCSNKKKKKFRDLCSVKYAKDVSQKALIRDKYIKEKIERLFWKII